MPWGDDMIQAKIDRQKALLEKTSFSIIDEPRAQ